MICSKCHKDKSTSEFHKRYNGFQSACKDCKSKYQKDNRDRNKVDFNKRKQEHVLRRRKIAQNFIAEYLSAHPCVDCNESDMIVLEFDHRSDKEFNVSELVHRAHKVEKIAAEIVKCDVRCANCHKRKTAKDFNWWKTRSVS